MPMTMPIQVVQLRAAEPVQSRLIELYEVGERAVSWCGLTATSCGVAPRTHLQRCHTTHLHANQLGAVLAKELRERSG